LDSVVVVLESSADVAPPPAPPPPPPPQPPLIEICEAKVCAHSEPTAWHALHPFACTLMHSPIHAPCTLGHAPSYSCSPHAFIRSPIYHWDNSISSRFTHAHAHAHTCRTPAHPPNHLPSTVSVVLTQLLFFLEKLQDVRIAEITLELGTKQTDPSLIIKPTCTKKVSTPQDAALLAGEKQKTNEQQEQRQRRGKSSSYPPPNRVASKGVGTGMSVTFDHTFTYGGDYFYANPIVVQVWISSCASKCNADTHTHTHAHAHTHTRTHVRTHTHTHTHTRARARTHTHTHVHTHTHTHTHVRLSQGLRKGDLVHFEMHMGPVNVTDSGDADVLFGFHYGGPTTVTGVRGTGIIGEMFRLTAGSYAQAEIHGNNAYTAADWYHEGCAHTLVDAHDSAIVSASMSKVRARHTRHNSTPSPIIITSHSPQLSTIAHYQCHHHCHHHPSDTCNRNTPFVFNFFD
jgi:hypothetical protein